MSGVSPIESRPRSVRHTAISEAHANLVPAPTRDPARATIAVQTFYWNPSRTRGPRVVHRLTRRSLNNFGDVLTPLLLAGVMTELGLDPALGSGRLLSIGSVLHYSQRGDTVWGSGVNEKVPGLGAAPNIDVRAVRGPLTQQRLRSTGTYVPDVFGDPGLLWARYFPRDAYPPRVERRAMVVIPNLNDTQNYDLRDPRVVHPCRPVHEIAARIAHAELVVGSSLHAIVLAESYGVPARLVGSQHEPPFKYDDYYRGTGRSSFHPATCVTEAARMGGERPPDWDAESLLAAFPTDLWAGTR